MKSLALVFGLGLGLVSATACSKKSKDSPAAAQETQIKLSGTLAITGTSAGLRLTNPALTDLSMYCVSFTLPPVAGTGAVGADGKFEVTLDVTGVSVGCFILDPQKAVLGTMVFKDQSKKDLSGAAQSEDRLAFEGGSSELGTVTLNLSTGKAEVDVAQIVGKKKDTSAALAAAYDFTGKYEFEASGVTAPEGYTNLCTEAEAEAARGENGGRGRCEGPTIGMPIYLKRLNGVVPGSTTPAFGMSFWASKDYEALCGSKLGFSYAEGIERGIDFTNSGVGEGDFTWDANLQDGWKNVAEARARYSLMKQETVPDFKGYPGFKQYFKQYRTFTCNPGQPCSDGSPTTASGFTFNANTNDSGCRTPDGKPYRLERWDSMVCQNEMLKDSAGANTGLHKNTCKKTIENQEITCINIGGTFLADGTPLQNAATRYPEDFITYAQGPFCDKDNDNQFDGDEHPQGDGNGNWSCNNSGTLKPGSLCSSITGTSPEEKLAQLRCYADFAHDNGDDDFGSCRREIRTNWSATTPEQFMSGKPKPRGQFVFEKLQYDSPTSASLRGEEKDFRGVQVGDSWTDCETHRSFSFSVRKIDGSEDLYGEMVETEQNVSPKPACMDKAATAPTKFMFRMKKTGT